MPKMTYQINNNTFYDEETGFTFINLPQISYSKEIINKYYKTGNVKLVPKSCIHLEDGKIIPPLSTL